MGEGTHNLCHSGSCLRDIDIIKDAQDFEVGFSVTTADERIRRIFEPHAPPIHDRISALDELHRAGVRTYAMIAPVLPGAEGLAELLKGKIDYSLIDRMNYHYADWVYRKSGWRINSRMISFTGRVRNLPLYEVYVKKDYIGILQTGMRCGVDVLHRLKADVN
jgi:hypothetical protein